MQNKCAVSVDLNAETSTLGQTFHAMDVGILRINTWPWPEFDRKEGSAVLLLIKVRKPADQPLDNCTLAHRTQDLTALLNYHDRYSILVYAAKIIRGTRSSARMVGEDAIIVRWKEREPVRNPGSWLHGPVSRFLVTIYKNCLNKRPESRAHVDGLWY